VSTTTASLSYDEHIKAIADAFDADFKAAEALGAAQLRREETRRALHQARRAFDEEIFRTVHQNTETTDEEVNSMFMKGDVEIPRL